MLRSLQPQLLRLLPSTLLTFFALSFGLSANAKSIECHLLGKDRMTISILNDVVKVTHFEDVSSIREKPTTTVRKVLYHHFSEPYDPRYKMNWEPAHSVIALESRGRDSVEFAPDLLVVNWGKVKLKSFLPYEERIDSRWICTRKD